VSGAFELMLPDSGLAVLSVVGQDGYTSSLSSTR